MKTSPARDLVVSVRLLENRYHGEPEWPPAPARLFQALVAASSLNHRSDSTAPRALGLLESLPAPVIAVPVVWSGQRVDLWVPNNDLDSVGGDPRAVANIRTAKTVQPRLLDAGTPLIYVWHLPEHTTEQETEAVCELALGLYQFGRGVDMAFATAEVMNTDASEALLAQHPGRMFRPTPASSRGGTLLACPQPGSLESLNIRYEATLERLQYEGERARRIRVFRQPPKARFARVAYDSPPRRMLFELRTAGDGIAFAVTEISAIVSMTEAIRDKAAARLTESLPERGPEIERALVGRTIEGLPSTPPELRIRLVPLPSVGHEQADHGIRRLLVEVPSGGPLSAEDVFWAFSGLSLCNPAGMPLVVTPADDQRMLRHYGVESPRHYRTWRTVTPAALPASAARRRIDPIHITSAAKGPEERCQEEAHATQAVLHALRHAHLPTDVDSVRVQREPFDPQSGRAETFAPDTRFAKERLWHVEVTLREGIPGPVVLGDGRFLGLGLMRPARKLRGVLAFEIVSGLRNGARPDVVATALRRAVMARYQAQIGDRHSLPSLITGHDVDGGPADERHPHLFFVFDPENRRLLIVSPHVRDRFGEVAQDRPRLRTLGDALAGFVELRAGTAGCLGLREMTMSMEDDPLFAPSRRWVSLTPYVVNRHLKHADAEEILVADLEASCRSAGWPTPRVTTLDVRPVRGTGVTGRAELEFEVAVPGPLMLGRTRHLGGGLFGHASRPM